MAPLVSLETAEACSLLIHRAEASVLMRMRCVGARAPALLRLFMKKPALVGAGLCAESFSSKAYFCSSSLGASSSATSDLALAFFGAFFFAALPVVDASAV